MGRVSFTASAPVLFAPLLSALVLLLFRPAVFRPALPAFRSSCSHQVVCRCDTFSVTASCSSLSDSTSTPIVPIFFWVLYCEAPLTTMIQNMLWSTALC
ncbi:uncharacterized protein LOC120640442 isoform X24 [Panicum virgatum]|uniref:uncharacterized protein LOC120640442 isoform X24 n=1 Tax=Panicum virgatum TaxID=38727 RepID=UPI0019D5F899|nr:uncharacterized protein LOC120640442 isoform X24 [Panicum virgatum]